MTKPLTPLLPTTPTRPASRFFGPGSTQHIIRDQLPLPTWLALGALAQSALYALLGRLAFAPAFLFTFYYALDTYAQATGWKRNAAMQGVLAGKTTAVFPDAETGGSAPAKQGVVVLLLGTRCNHPLGMFAPGFRQSGAYFQSMAASLDAHAEEFGYLGMSTYMNINDRAAKSELVNLAYFRTLEGLHAFAHSEYHMGAWRWWNRTFKEHPHLSIWHEIFEAPKGGWEGVYVNSSVTGLLATSVKVPDEEAWRSPVVDAGRGGVLKTSKGRMGRSEGLENKRVEGADVYERLGEEKM